MRYNSDRDCSKKYKRKQQDKEALRVHSTCAYHVAFWRGALGSLLLTHFKLYFKRKPQFVSLSFCSFLLLFFEIKSYFFFI